MIVNPTIPGGGSGGGSGGGAGYSVSWVSPSYWDITNAGGVKKVIVENTYGYINGDFKVEDDWSKVAALVPGNPEEFTLERTDPGACILAISINASYGSYNGEMMSLKTELNGDTLKVTVSGMS